MRRYIFFVLSMTLFSYEVQSQCGSEAKKEEFEPRYADAKRLLKVLNDVTKQAEENGTTLSLFNFTIVGRPTVPPFDEGFTCYTGLESFPGWFRGDEVKIHPNDTETINSISTSYQGRCKSNKCSYDSHAYWYFVCGDTPIHNITTTTTPLVKCSSEFNLCQPMTLALLLLIVHLITN